MSRSRAKVRLVITTIINVLLIAFSFFIIIFSAMMFDQVSGEGTILNWILFVCSLLLPALALAAIIAPWVMFARQKYTLATRLSLLPLISIGLILITRGIMQATCNLTFNCVTS